MQSAGAYDCFVFMERLLTGIILHLAVQLAVYGTAVLQLNCKVLESRAVLSPLHVNLKYTLLHSGFSAILRATSY